MALTYSEMVPLGSMAPDFRLSGTTDGVTDATVSLADFKNAKALLVVFMCNHCPYVKAINDRLAQLARNYQPRGLAVVAINSNDATRYPDDGLPAMKEQHRSHGFSFPYLVDDTQSVARAYGAVCTPDFFLFDDAQRLSYRGRLDDNWKEPQNVTRRDLADAVEALLTGGAPTADQIPSMGCSIKWKA